MSDNETNFTLETLLVILIILINTTSGPIFQKYNFHMIHKSGVTILLGIIVTLVSKLIFQTKESEEAIKFDAEIFFNIILPPIIFAAGYNIIKNKFLKYFLYIFLFGIIGTIFNIFLITLMTYTANNLEVFQLTYSTKVNINEVNIISFSTKEILLFAILISSSDAIASLSFFDSENESKMHSIIVGEGMLNDSVCILLYNIINQYYTSSKDEFTSFTIFSVFGKFLSGLLSAFILGTLIALISAIFLKKLNNFKLNRVQQCSCVIFFSYLSYILAQQLDISPIISLLFTGIFMSHYTFYNLTFQAREESSIVTKIMSKIATAFVFTYLGLTSIHYISQALSVSFIFFQLFFVLLSRSLSVYGINYFMRKFNFKNFKINHKQSGILFFCGSIKGAIAFGLSISIGTANSINRDVMTSTTIILVIITNIIFRSMLPFVINFFKKFDEISNEENTEENKYHKLDNINDDFGYLHPNFGKG